MWLLDHDLPRQIAPILKALKIDLQTTQDRGWQTLSNGALVGAASEAGFTCILTRDLGFGRSAESALKKFPHIGVVLITLPQQRGLAYAKSFEEAWRHAPISPIPGKLTHWPA